MDLITTTEAAQATKNSSTKNDDLLALYVSAISSRLDEWMGGAIIRREVTEQVKASTYGFRLSTAPVVALTSVTDGDGNVLDPGSYRFTKYGVVRPGEGSWFTCDLTVTYEAGFAADMDEVPAAIRLAALHMLRNLWRAEESRTVSYDGGGTSSTALLLPSTALPLEVLEMLDPFRVVPPGVG